jgi:starvation-inducible DNA-binding protein
MAGKQPAPRKSNARKVNGSKVNGSSANGSKVNGSSANGSRANGTRSRTATVVRGFTASPKLSANLQRVLVDLIELHLQGKQAHWNVVGHNFRDLHLQLDEIVDAAREASDTIAERMRALHASPDGRADTVVATTSLTRFPDGLHDTSEVVDLITVRLNRAAATARDVHDDVDAEDPSTADLLHEIIDTLEKYAWMVSAENMTV